MNKHLFNDEGASLVEYALVLALITLVCVAAMTYFGSSTALSLSKSGSLLSGAGS
ncbi:MAG: Flp family type IVb pilin [Acidimicrobiales bacterium]